MRGPADDRHLQMKLSRLSLLIFSALLAPASLAAGPAQTASSVIRIGVGAPMTGSDAAFGAELRNGVAAAIEDINAAGGLLGHRLAVEIGDDAGDPKQGVAVANKFVADHLNFVVGHFNSGVTLMASQVYADANILEITPSATNPQITERGLDLLFRTCGRDDQQAAVAATYLASLGNKKIAILHDRSDEGKGLADLTRKSLATHGVADVLYEGVNKDEKDYTNLVSRIKAADADIFYWGGSTAQGAAIVKALQDAGVTIPMLASDAIASDEFATIGGDAILGTLMTFPLDPRRRPQAAKIVQRFKARGIEPETYTLYAYAAMQIIREAAQKTKSLDPKAIAQLMHTGVAFDTVLGILSYDAKGDITQPDYAIFVWKKNADGKIDYAPLQTQ
jgi:branched-chain amino acid transport system substrate-binding protein